MTLTTHTYLCATNSLTGAAHVNIPRPKPPWIMTHGNRSSIPSLPDMRSGNHIPGCGGYHPPPPAFDLRTLIPGSQECCLWSVNASPTSSHRTYTPKFTYDAVAPTVVPAFQTKPFDDLGCFIALSRKPTRCGRTATDSRLMFLHVAYIGSFLPVRGLRLRTCST